jgi:hypothetical protein
MVDAGLLRKPGDQEMRNMERQTEIGLCYPNGRTKKKTPVMNRGRSYTNPKFNERMAGLNV